MIKFGRNYRLQVGTSSASQDKVLLIEPPFSIELDVTRNFFSSSCNTGYIRIYNLNEKSRNLIRFDINDFGSFRPVTLLAGYGNNLSTVFYGNISRCSSVREGSNFVTTIECLDGGYDFANTYFTGTIAAGTKNTDFFTQVVKSLNQVKLGAVGSFPGVSKSTTSYNEPALPLLWRSFGGLAFVDSGKAYLMNNDEFIQRTIPVINPAAGLLNTPQAEVQNLYFDIIFQPDLNVGSLVLLQSQTNPSYNKKWRVLSIKHRGMISPTVNGNLITSVTLNFIPNPKPIPLGSRS